jgi:hypothetical protein
MPESNLILDVRNAKMWIENQSSTLEEHLTRLMSIEREFLDRKGPFAAVPRQMPREVREAIESAAQEPGKDLLSETRLPRSS